MKILSIGNSFSKDAQRYLHALAKQDGMDMKTVNLFISGCPLRKHYLNMLDDCAHYDFEFNGEATGIKVSIRQALVSDNWDVVTLQQASPISGRWETYSPYLEELAAYVRRYCPHAKIFMHQTWAYEDGSEKLQALSLFATAEETLTGRDISENTFDALDAPMTARERDLAIIVSVVVMRVVLHTAFFLRKQGALARKGEGENAA